MTRGFSLTFLVVLTAQLGNVYPDESSSWYEEPRAPDPDSMLNVTQIITRWNYPVENYEVTTKDGYILQIQRIPHGLKDNSTANRRVVFLQHGLFSSAFDFVNNLPHQSMGYVMADHGYDVWLGNIRGNTYSKRHVNMSSHSKEFWEFSFDEFTDYDMPAMIDFVLEKTGQESLYYVGHSQGTIVMFGLLSTQPEYQKKIKVFAAMGPVTNVTYITSPVRYIAPFSKDLGFILEWLGTGEFGNQNRFFKLISETICAYSVSWDICKDAIWLLAGVDSKQLNVSRLSVYVSHSPAGTSVQNMVHLGQEINSARFQKFDFGALKNLQKYGRATPPEYDVRKIKEVPIGLYWSANDWLADPSDVRVLAPRLSTLAENYEVPEEKFTHVDFILGTGAHKLVYEPLMKFFDRY